MTFRKKTLRAAEPMYSETEDQPDQMAQIDYADDNDRKLDADGMTFRYSAVDVKLVGIAPLYCNSLSMKTRQTLLLPEARPRRRTAADRALAGFKHDPLQEYRDSVTKIKHPDCLIGMRASAIKGAMVSAAYYVEGMSMTRTKQMLTVEGDYVPIYGVPKLRMDEVRQADIRRTPDVRTRAIIRDWATIVSIRFTEGMISLRQVLNLLTLAGMNIGIGDFRQEKGGGYGRFSIAEAEPLSSTWDHIVASSSRKLQEDALEHPECDDPMTEELYTWYRNELEKMSSAPPPASAALGGASGKRAARKPGATAARSDVN